MDLVERVIPADEPVLYEGGARGRPPLGPALQGVAIVLALGGCLAMAGAGITVEVGSASVKVPAIVSLLVALGAVELFRFARWRSRRYVVTTRRVLVIKGVFWPAVIRSLPRNGDERVLTVGDDLVLDHAGVDLPLDGLPGAEGANVTQALATFDRTPPAPLPPPFWTGRRTRIAGLLVVLLLAAAAVLRAAPWRVTVEASWTPGGAVSLSLDSPHWGASVIDRLDLWYAEADGALVGRDAESMSMSGGLLREARTVTGRASYAIPTSASVITVHGAVRRRADGREVPFALEVTSGRPASLELRELLDAPQETDPPLHLGKTLREWVELLCEDPEENVRWLLICPVGDRVGPRDASAAPALTGALAHPDEDVRWIAGRLLAAIRAP